jgi:hypothetical protein
MPRGQWSEENLKLAVRSVLMDGLPKKAAARRYGIPRPTLQRHVQSAQNGLGIEKRLGRHCVLTPEQEEDLVSRLLDMEARFYGLRPMDVRTIVYRFCVQNKIQHTFSELKQMAGKKWMQSFMMRHKQLAFRLPEKTSMGRIAGFNRAKVSKFFDILGKQLFNNDGTRIIPPQQIYNVDETGVTVCQKAHKVIGKKGKKAIGIVCSAEKGKNVTVVCCVSAAGAYVPPMFIYPRVRMREDFLDRGPVGAIGRASKSGWMTEELFTEWFKHFLTNVQPKTRDQPTLLLADGHISHTRNLEVIQLARDNNVIILVFPSHCSHKLQPLDVAVFKSLKWNYDKEVTSCYMFS